MGAHYCSVSDLSIALFTFAFDKKRDAPFCDLWFGSKHMSRADIILCCGLCVDSNLAYFLQGVIIQRALLKHRLRIAICDFWGSNTLFSSQNVL